MHNACKCTRLKNLKKTSVWIDFTPLDINSCIISLYFLRTKTDLKTCIHAYSRLQMRSSCGGLMNDRHLNLWRTMVQMYIWQRQTPMWVNIKDSFKQLFLIQDSTIHHHVLWFWNRRVQEAGVKIWLKLRVLHKQQSQPRDLSAHCLQWLKALPHTEKHEIHGLRVENYDSCISRFCAWILHTELRMNRQTIFVSVCISG